MSEPILVIFEALPQTQTGAQVPEWFRVVPLGEDMPLLDNIFPSFSAGADDFTAMIRAFKARKYDMVIDYEHQTLKGVAAPAAGWVRDLEARPYGLCAKAEWTDKAKGYLQNREYRYFSPVLLLNRETQRPFDIRSVALTNTPSIIGLEPLVAKAGGMDEAQAAQAARAKKYGIGVKEGGKVTKPGDFANVPDEEWADPVNYRYPMGDAAHCQNALSRWGDESNRAQYTPEERSIMENRMKRRAKALGIKTSMEPGGMAMKGKLIALLKMKAEATDEEVLAQAIQTLAQAGALPEITQVLALKADATLPEIIGAIKGLQDGQTSLVAMKAELDTLKATVTEQQATAAVQEALKSGKILASEVEDLTAEARKDVAAFKARMDKRPVIGPPVENLPTQPGPVKGSALSDNAILMCKQLGLDQESFKTTRDQMAGAQ